MWLQEISEVSNLVLHWVRKFEFLAVSSCHPMSKLEGIGLIMVITEFFAMALLPCFVKKIFITRGLIIMEKSYSFFRKISNWKKKKTTNKTGHRSLRVSPSVEETGTEIQQAHSSSRHIGPDEEDGDSEDSPVLRSAPHSLANLWYPEHGQRDGICEPQQETSFWDPEQVAENKPIWVVCGRLPVGTGLAEERE